MKHAFTLIEILLVLSVILIVAMLGIGSYTAARQNMTIDLEADRLVILFHELRDASRAGARCFGIRFEKNENPQKIEAAYQNPRQGCDPNETSSPLPWSPEISVARENAVSVLFIPPHGNIKIQPDADFAEVTLALKKVPQKTRTITIEHATGRIWKLNN